MNTWIIGSTSNYSKAVANKCVGVTKFGRDNIDYGASFQLFMDSMDYFPDWIFINIGIEEKVSVHISRPDSEYITMLHEFSKTWLWKIRLYSWLYNKQIPCTVCDVTSTITRWPHRYREALPYAVLRGMGQQAAIAHNTDKLKIFQVSPNGITPERIDEYADKTVNWMKDPDTACKYIVDLDSNRLV